LADILAAEPAEAHHRQARRLLLCAGSLLREATFAVAALLLSLVTGFHLTLLIDWNVGHPLAGHEFSLDVLVGGFRAIWAFFRTLIFRPLGRLVSGHRACEQGEQETSVIVAPALHGV
jgi:hypothetical protein